MDVAALTSEVGLSQFFAVFRLETPGVKRDFTRADRESRARASLLTLSYAWDVWVGLQKHLAVPVDGGDGLVHFRVLQVLLYYVHGVAADVQRAFIWLEAASRFDRLPGLRPYLVTAVLFARIQLLICCVGCLRVQSSVHPQVVYNVLIGPLMMMFSLCRGNVLAALAILRGAFQWAIVSMEII